ncbi:MAG: Flp family type IVb pilin [Nitrospiraceae bacterium]
MVMVNELKRFVQDDEGATAIEYGLLAALIAVALIVGMQAVAGALNGTFNTVAAQLGS